MGNNQTSINNNQLITNNQIQITKQKLIKLFDNWLLNIEIYLVIVSWLLVILINFILPNPSFCQETEKRITQEQFAKILVRNMKLEGYLPAAPVPSDYVNLLEGLGISPLSGWKRKEFLTTEDYMTIIAKASGKEKIVYKNAVAACECNVKLINTKWQDYFAKYKRWPGLEELLENKEFFPEGAPKCPYGLKYKAKDKGHIVEQHYHPSALLLK